MQKDPSEQRIIPAQKCLHNSVETNPYYFKSKNPGHHYYDNHITRGTAYPGRKWQLAVTSYPSLPQMPSLLLNVSPVLFPTLLSTQTIGVPLLAIGSPCHSYYSFHYCYNCRPCTIGSHWGIASIGQLTSSWSPSLVSAEPSKSYLKLNQFFSQNVPFDFIMPIWVYSRKVTNTIFAMCNLKTAFKT